MVLPSHGVVAKTAWRGIRCSSVLKSSACKISEEKANQIVVTLCKCMSRNSDFCIIIENRKDVINLSSSVMRSIWHVVLRF